MVDVNEQKEVVRNVKTDVRLTTGLLVFIVAQTLTAVWWAASITSEQTRIAGLLETSLTKQDGQNLQLQINQNQDDIIEIKAILLRIDDKLDRVVK